MGKIPHGYLIPHGAVAYKVERAKEVGVWKGDLHSGRPSGIIGRVWVIAWSEKYIATIINDAIVRVDRYLMPYLGLKQLPLLG